MEEKNMTYIYMLVNGMIGLAGSETSCGVVVWVSRASIVDHC